MWRLLLATAALQQAQANAVNAEARMDGGGGLDVTNAPDYEAAVVGDETAEDIKYIVGLMKKAPKIRTPLGKGERQVKMTSVSGRQYMCTLPSSDPEDNTKGDGKEGDGMGGEEEGGEGEIAPLSLEPQLRKALGKKCVTIHKGYWHYSVCPFKRIKQYHMQTLGKVGTQIDLGAYVETEEDIEAGSYRQVFRGGDDNREVYVEYVCGPEEKGDIITKVEEPRIHHYEITVMSPHACRKDGRGGPKPSPLELLLPLKGGCHTLTRHWWTYSYCVMDKVTQYHVTEKRRPATEEEKKNGASDVTTVKSVTQQYTLGAMPEGLSTRELKALSPTHVGATWQDTYLNQTYGGGTECGDLAPGLARSVEVRHFCDPKTRGTIRSIEETSTCTYRLDFATDRLCTHEDFAPEQPEVREIACIPLATPENKPWKTKLLLDKAFRGDEQGHDANDAPSEAEASDDHALEEAEGSGGAHVDGEHEDL